MTGISRADLDTLLAALATPHQAARAEAGRERLGADRRRAPGGGRRPKLTLADQVTATLLHQRLALSPPLLARLFGVGKDTVRRTIDQTRRLLDQHGYIPVPVVAHLSTTGTGMYPLGRRTRSPPHTQAKLVV